MIGPNTLEFVHTQITPQGKFLVVLEHTNSFLLTHSTSLSTNNRIYNRLSHTVLQYTIL